MTSTLPHLRARLPELMLRDQVRLGRRLDRAHRLHDTQAHASAVEQIAAEIASAERRLAARRDRVPKITYPENLPVSQRRDDLLAAIRDNQVVIVAGETGSGKTTQLPKICLEAGRGVRGLIGHTQPRRLAARTVADRIAEELGTPLGDTVGFKVRFTDRVSENTLVKLMTDGILLAEIQTDRLLQQYDTLIIDEAHERSLNIDFILGYLRQLLPRRPDLKVIVTSATIDPERFAAHFAPAAGRQRGRLDSHGRSRPAAADRRGSDQPADTHPQDGDQPAAMDHRHDSGHPADAPSDHMVRIRPRNSDHPADTHPQEGDRPSGEASRDGDQAAVVGSRPGAPIIEVSGRTYPVEVRYRPLVDDSGDDDLDGDAEPRDQIQAICEAVDELSAEGPGDILVFLSGEREIRDTADALARHLARRAPRAAEPGAGETFQHPAQPGSTALGGTRGAQPPAGVEILPLFARLSHAEQHRVFAPHRGRRVVLATNVAETSLTVPGIRYVVDPGTARISRYSHRLKVQRLPIEPVSQASANQRKGRCGRLADGICIRLYSEQDFLARPEFTDPEILRTNLASVILQMTALGLGDLAAFPFIDPPDRRNITDGVRLLEELGAIEDAPRPAPLRGDRAGGRTGSGAEPRRRLTPLGRKLAQLPVDPRMARMVLAGGEHGCVDEVMVIAAALSIQDPRERPLDHQQAADQQHSRFTDRTSDFLTYLNLWRYLRDRQRELSSSGFRRMCKAEFLNYLRVREWQDIYGQLRQVGRTLGMDAGDARAGAADAAEAGRPGEGARPDRHGRAGEGARPDRHGQQGGAPGAERQPLAQPVAGQYAEADPGRDRALHTALLAGLLSHIGLYDAEKRDYLGARGARFSVFPGSALFKRPPRWVMAAELVETSRLWGRIAASIEPEWVEPLAGHLVKRSYSEPHWSKKQCAVLASEKVTLYGLPIVAARKVNYGRIDPELSRELFIRHALVEGDWDTHHAFFAENRALLSEVEELEHRARRRDILVDDQTLFDFYDQRLPADVVSARHFDAWWKRTRRSEPDLLSFEKSMLINEGKGGVSADDYPDTWRYGDTELPLWYQFEPGTAADGVTVSVPVALLPRLDPAPFTWQVPGLRRDLVTALIKSLPKATRRNFVPAPDYAAAVVERLDPPTGPGAGPDAGPGAGPDAGPLLPALEQELLRYTGVRVPRNEWDLSRVPDHLKMTFRVTGERGEVLAEGKDLEALRVQLAPKVRETLAEAGGGLERAGMRGWEIGELPRTVELRRGSFTVVGYPALVDEGDTVAVRVLQTADQQRAHHWQGTRRLLALCVPPPLKMIQARLSNEDRLALSRNPHGNVPALLSDCVTATLDALIAAHGGPPWDAAGFAALRDAVRAELSERLFEVVGDVRRILGAAYAVQRRLAGTGNPLLLPALTDLRAQLGGLVYPGFVATTGAARLPDLVRYLKAMLTRLEKVPGNPHRDREMTAKVHEVQREYRELFDRLRGGGPYAGELAGIRWMIEELRISYFAQGQGTPYPVSDVRIYRAIDDLAER